MDKALESYYENRLDMFTTDAWHDLIADLEMMKEATDTVAGINSEAELMHKKGELSIINWMLGLAAMSENAYAELKEETP